MANPTTPPTRQSHRFLSAIGVFAVCCEVRADQIEVGLLTVDLDEYPDIRGTAVTLYDPESGDGYPVHLPKLNAYSTSKITLFRYGQNS